MSHAIEPRDSGFALEVHRFVVRFAASAMSVFLWIVVFGYFVSASFSFERALIQTLFLYALAQVVTILVAPYALRIIGGNMLRGLVFGTILAAASFVYVGALASGIFPHGAAIIGILIGLYHALYRAPYQLERREVGESARHSFAFELLIALAPFMAGYIMMILWFYPYALFVAAAIALAALPPLLYVIRVHEEYSWGYRETFGHLLAKRNRELVGSSIKIGALGACLFLVVPLFLYFLISRDPVTLGASFSALLLLIFLFRAQHARALSEQRADLGSYVDEYTVLKEMSLAAGRLVVALIAAIGIAFLI